MGLKLVTKGIKTDLAAYRELLSLSQFESSLDPVSLAALDKGFILERHFIQPTRAVITLGNKWWIYTYFITIGLLQI